MIATAVAACEKAAAGQSVRCKDATAVAFHDKARRWEEALGLLAEAFSAFKTPASRSLLRMRELSMPRLFILLMPTAADPDLQALAQTIVPDQILSGPVLGLAALVR